MPVACDIKFEISNLKFENLVEASHTRDIDLLSPAEPRAMYRKFISSLVVPLSNPSAMLFETKGRTFELISKVAETTKVGFVCEFKNPQRECNCSFPNGQFFEG